MDAEANEDRTVIVQIIGTPGVGKTTLARIIEDALVAAGVTVVQQDLDHLDVVTGGQGDFQDRRLRILRERGTKVVIRSTTSHPEIQRQRVRFER
jgi:broad-specificity NMP kinase